MPIYNFECKNNHQQDVMLTHTEHEALAVDESGAKYVDCNVKYGDQKNPVCVEHAHQTFGSVSFVVQHLKRR